jgi:ABC-type branched-subunit amino acid transport system permease subunit
MKTALPFLLIAIVVIAGIAGLPDLTRAAFDALGVVAGCTPAGA